MGCSVTTGTTVHVVNPKGHQVVDLWAFVESDPTEYSCPWHTIGLRTTPLDFKRAMCW